MGDGEFRYTPIEIVLLHEGEQQKYEEDKSKLISRLKESTIKFSDLDFIFDLTYDNSSTEKFKNDYYKELTIELKAYKKYKAEQIVTFKTSTTINLQSTADTPVRLELTPSISLVDVTVKGLGGDIKINNLTANKTIIIEDGLVLEEGKNKFKDYDSWVDVPYLVPGNNNITLDKATVNVKIKYNPRWI